MACEIQDKDDEDEDGDEEDDTDTEDDAFDFEAHDYTPESAPSTSAVVVSQRSGARRARSDGNRYSKYSPHPLICIRHSPSVPVTNV